MAGFSSLVARPSLGLRPATSDQATQGDQSEEEEEEEEEEEDQTPIPPLSSRRRRPSSPSRPVSSNSGLYAFGNAAPGPSRSPPVPDSPGIVQVISSVGTNPDSPPPPPYTRHPTDENARKVTFLVSTPIGDMVTLSAKRSVRVSKALEAACNIFKLRVCLSLISVCSLLPEGLRLILNARCSYF